MLGSAAFEDTFLELLGRLRQKGEVLLLRWSAVTYADGCTPVEYILARICRPVYDLANSITMHT